MGKRWAAEVEGRGLLRALARLARRHMFGLSDVCAYVEVLPDRGYATDMSMAARCRWPEAVGIPDEGLMVYAEDILTAVRRTRVMGDATVKVTELRGDAVLVDGMRCRTLPASRLPTEAIDGILDGFEPEEAVGADVSPYLMRQLLKGLVEAGSSEARIALSGRGGALRVVPREDGIALEAALMPLKEVAHG